jgi:predicted nucleotide-binding protein with TIR-like domain
MLKTLEGTDRKEAEAVLVLAARSLLPAPLSSKTVGFIETPEQLLLSERVLNEIRANIPGVEQMAELEVRSAMLQLLSKELSEFVLTMVDVDRVRGSAWQPPLGRSLSWRHYLTSSSTTRKPKIFIGSAREGHDIVRLLKDQLSDIATVASWAEATSQPGMSAVEQLIRSASQFDFAVFVLAPNDADAIFRGRPPKHPSPLLFFEAGLLVGKLGVDRVSFVAPSGQPRLTSDLAGITTFEYDPSAKDQSIQEASLLLINRVKRLGPLTDARFPYSA